MALRRWKPFFPAFSAIDTAIEAATGAHSRDKYREARSSLVEMLCDADDSNGDRVEQLCRLLDGAMAEALLTLGAVPGPATPAMLATTDVARAVGGLLRHDAGKVRALARGVLAEWRASIEVRGATLDTLLQILREHEVVVQGDCIKQAAKTKKMSDQECPKKKMSPAGSVSIDGGDDRVRSEKTGDASGNKRKHAGATGGCCREREADDVKRRRKVPEEMVEHRPRKTEEADVKSRRSRGSSRRSTDERRFSTSTRHRRV